MHRTKHHWIVLRGQKNRILKVVLKLWTKILNNYIGRAYDLALSNRTTGSQSAMSLITFIFKLKLKTAGVGLGII